MHNPPVQPATDAGRKLVALAESLAEDFAARTDEHDRQNSFPHENIAALRESGFTIASAPEEFGGLGILSTVDILAALNRIGWACPSTGIAITMHMVGYWSLCREYEEAVRCHSPKEEDLRMRVQMSADLRVIACGVASEAGTNICAPLAYAEIDGGDVVVNGTKIFSTMSPAADLLSVGARLNIGDDDAEPGERYVMVAIPVGTPGLTLDEDSWDALGMRASGSGNTIVADCRVPASLIRDYGPWGEWAPDFTTTVFVGAAFLAGTFLGIAEHARELAVASAVSKRTGPRQATSSERAGVVMYLGQVDTKIAACRAILQQSLASVDRYLEDGYGFFTDELPPIVAECQKAKLFVMETAVDIVNDCMTVAGGASYMSKNPLSRLYRDVRAGMYMQPFSPIEGYEYLGKTAVGEYPFPR